MRIPFEMIPKCPVCGAPMTMNLRCDDTFVHRHRNMHVLYLELGVGTNTPGIVKFSFWRMTAENPRAVYACVNLGESDAPREIANQSICIDGDSG